MKYGQYYIDYMPDGDGLYCVIYTGDPKDTVRTPRELSNFCITPRELSEAGGKEEAAVKKYMLDRHPEAEIFIRGCTATFYQNDRTLRLHVFGEEILSLQVEEENEVDIWHGFQYKEKTYDVNLFRLDDDDEADPLSSLKATIYEVIDSECNVSVFQSVPLATNYADEIKNYLKSIHYESLSLGECSETVFMAWKDGDGKSREDRVSRICIDERNELYVELWVGYDVRVELWDINNDISNQDYEKLIMQVKEILQMRECTDCGLPMVEGFYDGGDYHCSDTCLYKTQTRKEWIEKCDENSDDCYYTSWNE